MDYPDLLNSRWIVFGHNIVLTCMAATSQTQWAHLRSCRLSIDSTLESSRTLRTPAWTPPPQCRCRLFRSWCMYVQRCVRPVMADTRFLDSFHLYSMLPHRVGKFWCALLLVQERRWRFVSRCLPTCSSLPTRASELSSSHPPESWPARYAQ